MLYFASDGFEGYGGLDLFRSRLNGNAWGKPANLLRPINSGYDDFAIQVVVPDEEGYFSSNRNGGNGQDDIWHYTKRTLLFTLDGHVKDEMTLLPLENAQVLLIGGARDTAVAATNALGYYSLDTGYIQEGRRYDLVFRKGNYFAKKGSVDASPFKDDHRFSVDAELEPIPDKPIVLPDILYALDDWRLQPQYEDSLRNLVILMLDNPNLVIELRSHTDSRASHKYNDTLSQKRAQSVVDFLIREGIEPGRLVAKGYGERVFRVLNKDIAREGYTFPAGAELNDEFVYALPGKEIQEAAFQLNRRTEFAVIAKDYNPKNNAADSQIRTIQVISDTSETAVDYIDSQGVKEITIYLNDYGTRGLIYPGQQQSVIGESIVINWLKKGVVNRNDFVGNFEEIMVDGRIVNGSEMIIKKVWLADKVVGNVKVKVDLQVGDCIWVGEDILGKLGAFTMDEEKKQLIFK
jgi:peptidoglycan-associated lipoprotein